MTCFNRLTDEARKLISELGSKNVQSLAFRDNWLFVGGKGVTVTGDFEKVTATTSWTPYIVLQLTERLVAIVTVKGTHSRHFSGG